MKCSICNHKTDGVFFIPSNDMVRKYQRKPKTNFIIYLLYILKGSETWCEKCVRKLLH